MNASKTIVTILAVLLVAFSATNAATAQTLTEFKITASDAATGDGFGSSVSLDGDRALVGVPGDGDAPDLSGSAYVFRYDGTSWVEEAKLTVTPSDPVVFGSFGTSVSLHGDLALVGAPGGVIGGSTLSGSAYVFRYDGASWVEETKLTASDAAPLDSFGWSVSLYGNLALVGAQLDDDAGEFSGSAYVFRYDSGTWVEEAKLTASDAVAAHQFGESVSLYGNRALVGARLDDVASSNAGAAYVFHYDGASWVEEAKLTASDAADGDLFGESVSLHGDVALVGVPPDDDAGNHSGSAYVFRYDGANWVEEAKLTASDAAAEDAFGHSVSVHGDLALVGAFAHDDVADRSGSAYVFRYDSGTWVEEAKLTASDAGKGDHFGISVSLHGDWALVGAHRGNFDSGSAYLFRGLDPNSPPTADAGPDQAIRAAETAFLDGSASFDDNTATGSLLYSWSFSALPPGSAAALFDAETAAPSFVADVAGTYVAQLIVTDEAGLSSPPDDVLISSDNLAPTANAGSDQLVIAGSTVLLDGSASNDPESDPLGFAWTITAAPTGSTATLSGTNSAFPSFVADIEGLYEVTLAVSDFLGPGTPDTVEITATTAENLAELCIVEAADILEDLVAGQITTKGNQAAFLQFLSQAIRDIQNGDLAKAIDKLGKTIERTDGCVLRGAPDGNGQGMDWITDCTVQFEIYGLLNDCALDALTP